MKDVFSRNYGIMNWANRNKFYEEDSLEAKVCIWTKGSTNPQTLKLEKPLYCIEKDCNGYNTKCEKYIAKEDINEF
jgi:hypothetical protein